MKAPEKTAEPSSATDRSRRARAVELIELAALTLLLFAIVTLTVQPVHVEGDSMVGTLHNGDYLFADKISYHLHPPGRGDIAVLLDPQDTSTALIKRIIGLPGDTVAIDPNWRDPEHTDVAPQPAILVTTPEQSKPQRVTEAYLPEPWTQRTSCCDSGGRATNDGSTHPLTIPKDEYFVLGDNRNYSKDTRSFGLVPRANIEARAWIRAWPFSRLGGLGSGPALAQFGLLVPVAWRRGRRRATTEPVS